MTVGIIGLGLVGGSLALDLVAQGRGLVATDTDPDARSQAADAGIPIVDDLDVVVERCDVLVVAVPPAAIADVIQHVAALRPDLPVTDVASVKSPTALGLNTLPSRWIGGHPMAGTERSGFPAARRGMLAGATWLLTPHDEADLDALTATLDLVLSVQAVPVITDADTHDRLVAAVSHVTHLLAWALHGTASGLGRHVVDLVAGPSFRDATRVAASDPTFWADVVQRNRAAVTDVLGDVQQWLTDAMHEDADTLASRLAGARRHPLVGTGEQQELLLGGPGGTLDDLRALGAQGYAVTHLSRDAGGVRLTLHRR
jgi:prephenate dehydrogenase